MCSFGSVSGLFWRTLGWTVIHGLPDLSVPSFPVWTEPVLLLLCVGRYPRCILNIAVCHRSSVVSALISSIAGCRFASLLQLEGSFMSQAHSPHYTFLCWWRSRLIEGLSACLAFEDPHLGEGHSSSTPTVPLTLVDVSVAQIVYRVGLLTPHPTPKAEGLVDRSLSDHASLTCPT